MHNIIALIGFHPGGGSGHWWGLFFFIFGAVMFFPITILEEISERTGLVIRWRHVIGLEVIAASLTVISMILLKWAYPELHWFEPVGGFVFAAIFRGVAWFFDRDDDL